MDDKTRQRILELEDQIADLQKERNQLRGVVKHIFDAERDYLFDQDDSTYDQFVDRRRKDGKLGKRVMTKRFRPLWTGIMNASMYQAFGYTKQLKYLSEEEIQTLKPIIRNVIDELIKYNKESGLNLW